MFAMDNLITITQEEEFMEDAMEMEHSYMTDMMCGENKAILATGGYDHTVKLWQTHTGLCYWTGQHVDSQVNSLNLTPDRTKLAAAGYCKCSIYDLNNGNPNPVTVYEQNKNVTCVGFQNDSKWMYTTGEDGFARIWDIRFCHNMQCNRTLEFKGTVINSAALHPNQVELILCDDAGNVCIWNLKTNESEKFTLDRGISALDVCVDPKGKRLACVDNKGFCHVWDMPGTTGGKQDQKPFSFLAHNRQALKCEFSPDSTLLVTTSADQTAKVWNVREDFAPHMELKSAAPGGQRWVWDAVFTNDSKYLITGSSDGFARLWNISPDWKNEDNRVEREYIGHQKAVTAIAFADSENGS